MNLDSKNLKPVGWDKLADEKPELLSFSDISIYELHIRDFRLAQFGFSFSFKKKKLSLTRKALLFVFFPWKIC